MKKILIIGAGIMGLSIARSLSNHKYEITILEKNKAGQEASWAAAGLLNPQSEHYYDSQEYLDFSVQCRDAYVPFCQELEQETDIALDLIQNGAIMPLLGEDGRSQMKLKYEQQKTWGHGVEILRDDELRAKEPNLHSSIDEGLYLKDDARLNNRKLIDALLTSIQKRNITLIEKCEVQEYTIKDKKIKGIKSSKGTIDADIVINCAGSWSSLISQGIIPKFEVKPIKGQIVSLALEKPLVNHVIFPIRYEHDPYIVPRQGELLIGSTMEDVGFNRKVDDSFVTSIIKRTSKIIPAIRNLLIKERWAGFRPAGPDNFPLIGKTPIENLYLATAHFRKGILLAPLTAKAIEEMIVNDKVLDIVKPYAVERLYD